MNCSRRTVLATSSALVLLVAAGIISPEQAFAASDGRPAFDAKTLSEALAAVGGTTVSSKDIAISSPDIAENGAVVPVNVASTIPNTQEIYILVEKNPQPMSAGFIIPGGTEPAIQTRVKMGQSSNVIAVVKADGKLYSHSKETKVTLGGCGG